MMKRPRIERVLRKDAGRSWRDGKVVLVEEDMMGWVMGVASGVVRRRGGWCVVGRS